MKSKLILLLGLTLCLTVAAFSQAHFSTSLHATR
jgi:hypothetical protein